MLASAVSTYVNRYAAMPGRRAVVFTNNDSGYQAALDLKRNGAEVVVVDPRVHGEGSLPAQAEQAGIRAIHQAVIRHAMGERHVRGVVLQAHGARIPDDAQSPTCALVVLSRTEASRGGKE